MKEIYVATVGYIPTVANEDRDEVVRILEENFGDLEAFVVTSIH